MPQTAGWGADRRPTPRPAPATGRWGSAFAEGVLHRLLQRHGPPLGPRRRECRFAVGGAASGDGALILRASGHGGTSADGATERLPGAEQAHGPRGALLSPGQHGEVLQRLRQRESVAYLPAQDQAFLTSPEEETWSSKLFGGPGARFDGTRMLQL